MEFALTEFTCKMADALQSIIINEYSAAKIMEMNFSQQERKAKRTGKYPKKKQFSRT